MVGVLKVRGSNNHRVDILAVVEFIGIANACRGLDAILPGDLPGNLLAPLLPDVADGDQVEVEVLGIGLEAGDERTHRAVTRADQRHPDPAVGPEHPLWAKDVETGGCRCPRHPGCRRGRRPQKIASCCLTHDRLPIPCDRMMRLIGRSLRRRWARPLAARTHPSRES